MDDHVRPTSNCGDWRRVIGGSGKDIERTFDLETEFLCPIEALDDWLDGDYSPEGQDDAAGYFNVSPLTVRTLLVNHGRIDRDELDHDYEAEMTA